MAARDRVLAFCWRYYAKPLSTGPLTSVSRPRLDRYELDPHRLIVGPGGDATVAQIGVAVLSLLHDKYRLPYRRLWPSNSLQLGKASIDARPHLHAATLTSSTPAPGVNWFTSTTKSRGPGSWPCSRRNASAS